MYDIVVFLVCFCGVCVFVLQECAALLSWLDNLLGHLANFLHNHLLVHNWPGWPVDVWGWDKRGFGRTSGAGPNPNVRSTKGFWAPGHMEMRGMARAGGGVSWMMHLFAA